MEIALGNERLRLDILRASRNFDCDPIEEDGEEEDSAYCGNIGLLCDDPMSHLSALLGFLDLDPHGTETTSLHISPRGSDCLGCASDHSTPESSYLDPYITESPMLS